MAWRFVKQPDGLLARFSEVVDDFTDYALTEGEAVDLCVSRGLSADEAKRKVKNALEDLEPWTDVAGAGDSRWKDALLSIRFQHGTSGLMSALAEMGFADYPLDRLETAEADQPRAIAV